MRCVPVRHDKVSTGCMALGLAIGFGTGRVSTSLFLSWWTETHALLPVVHSFMFNSETAFNVQ